MKLTLTTLLVLCSIVVLVACGSAHSTSTSSPNTAAAVGTTPSGSTTTSASAGYLKEDGDNDGEDHGHTQTGENDDQSLFASYSPASPQQARTISTLVRNYYQASSAENARRACELLSASLLSGLVPGPATGGHGGCATMFEPLLAQQHRRLLEDQVTTMTVIRVLVKGQVGLVVVGFRAMPESDIVVAREGRTWKIDALFDSLVP